MFKKITSIAILAFALSCTPETPKPNVDERDKFVGEYNATISTDLNCVFSSSTINSSLTTTASINISKDGTKLKLIAGSGTIYAIALGNTFTTEKFATISTNSTTTSLPCVFTLNGGNLNGIWPIALESNGASCKGFGNYDLRKK